MRTLRLPAAGLALAVVAFLAIVPAARAEKVQIDPNYNTVTCAAGCASPVVPTTFTPAQISVLSTATQVVAARAGRSFLSVENSSTTDIWCGPSNAVTISTGHLLPGSKGAALNIAYAGALWCIVASTAATVTEAEIY